MRTASGLALAALLSFPVAAGAATVREHTVVIQIQADGKVQERDRFVVHLDQPGDLKSWSPYAIYLDENRTLLELNASATKPDGQVVKIGRKDLDVAEVRGQGELHSSRKLRSIDFPMVPVGSTLTIEYQLLIAPYFQAGEESLGPWDDPVESLRVEVKGGSAGWRWRLDGPKEGLTVQESPGGVVVTASGRKEGDPVDNAPGQLATVLRYAWGPQASWSAVGGWYEGLLSQVPRGADAVKRKAMELTAGKASPRERAQALATFVQRDVRYVAVEVGIGGYRPAPPADVLTRLWGDCKDKALLLVDLLKAAGIDAYPVLIRLDSEGKVDREFPQPNEFNHAIVAISKDALSPGPEDPVAGGYLFVDATQTTGSLGWFHPGVQDQEALVVRGERSDLIHTPILPTAETWTLRLDLAANAAGTGSGQVHLDLTGDIGYSMVHLAATAQATEVEHSVRRILSSALPGVNLLEPHWKGSKDGIPKFEIAARVEIPGLLAGEGPARAFLPAALKGFPSPSVLDERKIPVVLSPGTFSTVWRIKTPDGWCPPEARDLSTKNELGAFRQTVRQEDGLVMVDSRTEVTQRWVEPERFPALKELALAEVRAQKRRIRLECPKE